MSCASQHSRDWRDFARAIEQLHAAGLTTEAGSTRIVREKVIEA